MLLLNPETPKATQAPLRSSRGSAEPGYAPGVRVALALAAAAAAALAGHAVSGYASGTLPAWAPFVPAGAFVLLASLATVLVANHRHQLAYAPAWGVAAAALMPWQQASEFTMLAAVVAISALSGAWAYHAAAEGHTTLHLFAAARRYASTLATGFALALVLLYGAALARGGDYLPDEVVGQVADQSSHIVAAVLPEGSSRQATSTGVSVGEFALAATRKQLEADPRFLALDPGEQARVLRETASSAVSGMLSQLGVEGSATSTVSSVAQNTLGNIVAGLQTKYGWYFTLVWLVGAFFLARSAAMILAFGVAAATWGILHVALALNLLRIETVPSIHERVTL